MTKNENQKASLSPFVIHTAEVAAILIILDLFFDILLLYFFFVIIFGGALLGTAFHKRTSKKARYSILVFSTSLILAIIVSLIRFKMTDK